MAAKQPAVRELLRCRDGAQWREWLAANGTTNDGVQLVLAKAKAEGLHYDEALDEALCFGWIDAVKRGYTDTEFLQTFTPRRSRSIWSQRNREHIQRLESEGRMTDAGRAEVDRAKADGRWAAAYGGSRTIQVPDELTAALAASPAAAAMFETLSSQNRFAILFRIGTVKRAETRARKIAEYVSMLERGETIHPQ